MEIHGYTESGSIDATIEGVRMTIPNASTNRHRQMIAEWEAKGNTIPAYVQPEVPTSYRLYKSTLIRRMTDQEAATMEAVLADAGPKLRMLFNSVEYFVSDDPLFRDLHAAVSAALSDSRATELLASDG